MQKPLPSPLQHQMTILRKLSGPKNYFEIFELPVSYDVAVNELTPKYHQLLKKSHPDKFQQSSSEQREKSEQQSRLVNEAYKALQNPLGRGLHMLDLKNSPLEEGKLDLSSDMLAEIYEINEELSDVQDPKRLQAIKVANDAKLHDIIKQVSAAFKDNRTDDAKMLLSKMKYHTTIEDRIRVIELEIGVTR